MRSKGDVVDGGGHDEKGDDPPGVSHAGDFDGEVRVGFQVDAGFGWVVIFLAVFAFCEAVVVVH